MRLHFIHDWSNWQVLEPTAGEEAIGLRVQVSRCFKCGEVRKKNIFL